MKAERFLHPCLHLLRMLLCLHHLLCLRKKSEKRKRRDGKKRKKKRRRRKERVTLNPPRWTLSHQGVMLHPCIHPPQLAFAPSVLSRESLHHDTQSSHLRGMSQGKVSIIRMKTQVKFYGVMWAPEFFKAIEYASPQLKINIAKIYGLK